MVKVAQGDVDGGIDLLNQALALDPVGDNANQINKDLAYIATLMG